MSLLDSLLGWLAPHACLACGRESELLCVWCRSEHLLPFKGEIPLLPINNLWIRTAYGGHARMLLRRFKFERAMAAAKTIAGAMGEALPYLPRQTVVVPIPTATSRVRSRGYDHAVLLARNIARIQGLPYARALTRLTQSRQVGASRAQRLTQLEGAFATVKPKLINNADILLVDDVLTTGATLAEAAKTLRAAGAATVSALVFAHKQMK
jgi:ComF family protein